MNPFVFLITTILSLVWWAVMIWFVLNLLIQFNVVNTWHPLVSRVYRTLEAVIEPLLRPIRQVIPPLGGIDLSPLILILALGFLERAVVYYGI